VVQSETFDVVVVGSGAGGLLSAIRAVDLGLSAIVLEKSDRYGGTSAVSGGAIWIPNNDAIADIDSPRDALAYLKAVTKDAVPEAKLIRYVDVSPRLLRYLRSLGVDYYVHPQLSYPDYYPGAPGALPRGRNMFVRPMDGAALGEEFFRLRESYPEFKLLGRMSLDLEEAGVIGGFYPGWRRAVAKVVAGYWGDVAWRRRTRRDRRLTIGNALVGGLRAAMLKRAVPLRLKTALTRLDYDGGRVTGVTALHEGRELHFRAAQGVVLATGGFEQSQDLRLRYLDQATEAQWSATPRDNNAGDALRAAEAIGADTAFLNEAWWAPTVSMPARATPNTVRNVALFFERGFPHCLAVNRLGKRFVNEICSYHQFGQAMLRDNAETGANLPCWLVFDAQYRSKYPLGGLLPGRVEPDAKLPPDWFDNFLYRAGDIRTLAGKIGLAPDVLAATVDRFNGYARRGVDDEFGKGGNVYNQFFGDPRNGPSPVLGAVERPPFYAVRLDLGDIGTKGGPKTNEDAAVLDLEGRPIPGLYAIGNAAGSVMGGAYPGAGATLGSAMTFGYVAATRLAQVNEW
jgi:3-oxosteroid 1-dehydrogenase